MSRGRSYLRVLPESFARKAFGVRDAKGKLTREPYPAAAVAAFYGILCLAEHQPERGRFASLRIVKATLEGPHGEGRSYARQVPYLVEHRDLIVQVDGSVYVDGWDELQEGDIDVPTRMRRYRDRAKPGVTAPVTPSVTASDTAQNVTHPRSVTADPSTASSSSLSSDDSLGKQRSGRRLARDGSPSRDPGAPPPDDLGSVLSWLAAERHVSVPEGAAMVELARLVDQHTASAVIEALGAQDPAMKDGRQYVFGAMKHLNPLPSGSGRRPDREFRPTVQEAADAFERF